jgi:hypothetical protein
MLRSGGSGAPGICVSGTMVLSCVPPRRTGDFSDSGDD